MRYGDSLCQMHENCSLITFPSTYHTWFVCFRGLREQVRGWKEDNQVKIERKEKKILEAEVRYKEISEIDKETINIMHRTCDETTQENRELREKLNEFLKKQRHLEQKAASFADLQTEYSGLQLKCGEAEKSVETLNNNVREKEEKEKQLQAQIEQNDQDIKIRESRIAGLNNDLERTKGQLHNTEAQLAEMKGQFEQSKTQLQETQGQLEQSQGELQQSQEHIGQIQNQLQERDGQLAKSQTHAQKLQNELIESQASIEEVKNKFSNAKTELLQELSQVQENLISEQDQK